MIESVTVRQRQLRWPIPMALKKSEGQAVVAMERRAKWLIWRLEAGHLLWHLGMSGSFRGWNPAADARTARPCRYPDDRRTPDPFIPIHAASVRCCGVRATPGSIRA